MGDLKILPKQEQDEGVLETLKALVRDIEDGEISVETFYLIALGDKRLTYDGQVSEPMTVARDSGLTVNEAVTLLEREKFRILCAADGVAYR